MTDRSRFQRSLDTLASVAILVTCGVVVWSLLLRSESGPSSAAAAAPPTRQLPVIPVEAVRVDGVEYAGSAQSELAVLLFSDFQCPFCRNFAVNDWAGIRASFVDTGIIRFGFVHMPIEKIHPEAAAASKAAICAGRQGKFWPMHDLLFDASPFDSVGLLRRAGVLRLDSGQFSTCLAAEAPELKANAELAKVLGVTGTPTFYFGRFQGDDRILFVDRFEGARPAAEFQRVIDGLSQR
jgi:protein-disulfide isomerase